ncbi:MAG: NYN domain-containing protein [Myxococcota bacterium]
MLDRMTTRADVRVALFFDGKNFHVGWKETAQGRRIDFMRLAKWLVQRTGGTALSGAYYFTGIQQEISEEESDESQHKLLGFLEMLENQPGFFVQTFFRKSGCVNCSECGRQHAYVSDKETDLALVSHMLQLAAVDGYDAAILLSGDGDYAPALQSVRAMGKQVHIASWGSANVSRRIRMEAFSQIDMLEGLGVFEYGAQEQKPLIDAAIQYEAIEVVNFTGQRELDAFISELTQAEKKFEGGYVGLNYFLNRWRSEHLDENPNVRRSVLNQLLVENWVETYDVGSGKMAVRLSDRARERGREFAEAQQ